MKKQLFLLGGADTEMSRIREYLQSAGAEYCDKQLGWGAKLSAYLPEILAALAEGVTIVPIELEDDLFVSVDHHGKRAGEPASLLQVLSMLGVTPISEDLAIAADDAGGPLGLLRHFDDDAAAVRAYYRTQFATSDPALVEMVESAWAERQVTRNLTVVRMPQSKTTVACKLHAFEYDVALFLGDDGEVNFYQHPATVHALVAKFGGWSGGEGLEKPELVSCYWGISGKTPAEQEEILQFVLDQLAS